MIDQKKEKESEKAMEPTIEPATGREPYWRDDSLTLWHGDALSVLRELPNESVNCCLTSPPYYGLRDYGQEGQYGLEPTPSAYVETMREVFAEVRRVLAEDGTLWLNLGDSYAGSWGNQGRKDERGTQRPINGPTIQPVHDGRYGDVKASRTGSIKPGELPAKNLLGIPWRVAFALQDDGWILRNNVIWSKPNAMPESVTDRLSNRHEHVFLLVKSRRYWFDLDPIRERTGDYVGKTWEERKAKGSQSRNRGVNTSANPIDANFAAHPNGRNPGDVWSINAQSESDEPKRPYRGTPDGVMPDRGGVDAHPNGRNPGDVWSITTQPFSGAHFAVMPMTLAERCIQAGCKPGGIVLDPFSGAGTSGEAAARHGRRFVGIDLSADYLNLSLRTRLAQTTILESLESL